MIYLNQMNSQMNVGHQKLKWNNGKYRLTILGTEKSWYFPGGTVLFVVTLKDVEIK